ncbi:uncharacterized protein LTR77_005480 [Saxophila tyrrhenica]|uniref:G-protein coupled receptors family 2 profile 2 domain-containing protein n=1 Tax=Saxophila tyrrhenica TaxID=1690608 RepID=A0AAV9PBL9_9PEZI|nr:hypothetical protein LTR77_005480 [Saxophila tyrrhenica]
MAGRIVAPHFRSEQLHHTTSLTTPQPASKAQPGRRQGLNVAPSGTNPRHKPAARGAMPSNTILDPCPYPFLPLIDYPQTGGYLQGRFCGPVTPTQTCCLPCPLQQWVSSDNFEYNADVAYWFNVPALVCQVFLLVTFAVLPKEVSGRHYLSIGLCVALVLLEISFIIPLAGNPDQCYNMITPRDMYSSMSCAWSGTLLEVGAMSAVIWILLRSLWTHLRVCWNIEHTPAFLWIAHLLGWGLPVIFLAISLPITGVSFRVGGTCLPNPNGAFVTWFGWLITFAAAGAIIQFATTGFCLAIYLKSFFKQDPQSFSSTTGASMASGPSAAGNANGNGQTKHSARKMAKRLAWRRVRKVMQMQWRSIALSLFVILQTCYFGSIYVAQVQNSKANAKPEHSEQVFQWISCLVQSGGDKDRCIYLAKSLSLPEASVITNFFLVSIIGIVTFLLMVRWSMLVAWWELICDPGRGRRRQSSAADWVSAPPKRLSLGRILASDRLPKTTAGGEEEMPKAHTGVLPSPEKDRAISVPEAGDVAKRHETTTLFDEDGDLEDERRISRSGRLRGGDDVI